MDMMPMAFSEAKATFGRWLITQTDRGGLVGPLARGACQDRRFPLEGSPDDVRDYLHRMQADGDAFAAVDDAELDWLCA